MIPTRILYHSSNPDNHSKYEWFGELPLLHVGLCLSFPERAAIRVTDVRLVLGPGGFVLEQVVTTGL